LGLLYCLDIHIWDDSEQYRKRSGHVRFGQKYTPDVYNPKQLDTDQWMEAAKALGAKYAIFTATHEAGFLQWQSNIYPYGLKQSPWRQGKGDVVRMFVDSCRKYNIEPGLFVGLRTNNYWGVKQYKVQNNNPEKQAHYITLCEKIVEELCSQYGELCELWFDGGVLSPEKGGPNILPIVEKYQPETIFYHSEKRGDHRWIGNEDGVAGYPCWATMPDRGGLEAHQRNDYQKLLPHGDPNGNVWSPGMCDVPLRDHKWFWMPDQENLLYTKSDLIDMYYKSVGRNCNLIFGTVIDQRGLVPSADIKCLQTLGDELRSRFGNPIINGNGEGEKVTVELPELQRVDHISIMEDIQHGERIRAYVIKGLTMKNNWKTLAKGSSVGHKRLHRISPVDLKKIQLHCTEFIAKPIIKHLRIFIESITTTG
jgi:alpha-L-fucosidase